MVLLCCLCNEINVTLCLCSLYLNSSYARVKCFLVYRLLGFLWNLFSNECRVIPSSCYLIFCLTNISSSQERSIDEPPASPIRVDSRATRYGRAIVIKQGMLPSARSPSAQTKPTQFDYESVAQNLKAIDQNRQQQQNDVNKGDEFERWQKQQREIAEQRERDQDEQRQREEREHESTEQREREQREREQRDQREREQREQREQREREQREREQREREQREREQQDQREREQREQREREQREREQQEQREREQREQREREQREREQRERDQLEQRGREQREREQREREQREQREREQRERDQLEQRGREQREREQREREQREQREREQREREQQERQERERKEREERARLEREKLEQERLEKEKIERERLEFVERQKKEQDERVKAERQLELQKHREDRPAFDSEFDKTRLVERERKMLYPGEKSSKETLDHIEAMSSDEVEREFQRRLEVEKKRRNLDDNADRRSGGLVSVTRVTYHHPDRNDQAERDRKLQMIIQERRLVERQRQEADRRNVFEVDRAQKRDAQRKQQEDREREQEEWLKQQKDKHDQSRRGEQSRVLQDRKAQDDQDVSKIRSELQQRREQEDIIRKNLQRLREEEERKMAEDHQQDRLNQEAELERKLEEQSILREKENEARRQLQEEQRVRSARGVSSEPDHVMELKERALRDYERRRALIDQEINRQQVESRYQEEQRQKELDEVKAKFDQQRPVSALKTSNGTKPKKQVSFSSMSTEFREPASPTYVVGSSSGYTAKITPAASVRQVQTRPPADHDTPPIPRPPPPDDDDDDDDEDFDPPPLPPPPPPEELEDDDYFPPPPPGSAFNERSSSSSTNSSDPRHPMDTNSRNHSDVLPADYPYPPNRAQYRNNSVGSGFGTFPRAARPMSYPTPADLDSIQLNDTGLKYSGSRNNISGYNSIMSGLRETQSLGRINTSGEVEANRMRMARVSLSDESKDTPPPIPKKPEHLAFKEKMKMFNQDGTPKNRATVSRWQRDQLDVNGDISYT